MTSPAPWFAVENAAEVSSPALLVYPDRVEENTRRMIAIAGKANRLRPHMKTHKMPAVIRGQIAQGITRFKCATIAEAEMTASCGAPDVLLAYQPVGPSIVRLLQLVRQYPDSSFSTVVDDENTIREISKVFASQGQTISLLLDLDCGMHRCGIEPGVRAIELYRLLDSLPGIKAGGLHAYDGHLHDSDPIARGVACEEALRPVFNCRNALIEMGAGVPRLVAGGTPTFPMHAKRPDTECSPGTCVFWDFGYADKLQDMDFLVAALVLTRVVSKPGHNRLCLDLGHKSIAAENPQPRVRLFGLEDAHFVTHSEEHLVVETSRAANFGVGDALFGVPRHICPTVALHSEAVVVQEGRAVDRWRVSARERRLTI